MERRASVACVAIASAAVLIAACGGSPNGPGPITEPPPIDTTPPPAPPNALPVIDSISVQGRRAKEPANFADLAETIDVSAKVRDDETAADELQYEWTVDIGSFEGTGARVTWRAPGDASTPLPVTLSLKVTENYGYPGGPKIYRQDVAGSAVLSLHNSKREVGNMARQFLLDFSDSNIRDVSYIMRNFTDVTKACKDAKREETDQVTRNRIDYVIKEWFVGVPVVTVDFSTLCPYMQKGGDACAAVAVDWKSTRLTPGPPGSTPVGQDEKVGGINQVTAIYIPEQRQWGLCDSSFDGHKTLHSTFIR